MLDQEPVTEIIGRQPAWIIRSGITLIALIFAITLLLSFFIRYPDIIKSSVTLTSKTPPLQMIVKSNNIIDKVFVTEGQRVLRNAPLVLFDSTADFELLLVLDKKLQNIIVSSANHSVQIWLKDNMEAFGELQPDILLLLLSMHKQSNFINSNYFLLEIKQLRVIKKQYEKLSNQLSVQQSIWQEKIALEQLNLNKNERLSKQGLLSDSELIPLHRLLLDKKLSLQNANIQFTSHSIENNKLVQKIRRLEQKKEDRQKELNIALYNSISKLKKEIYNWKKTYLLVSPVNGVVSFSRVIRPSQYFKAGDNVLTLVNSTGNHIAILNVHQGGAGKIEKGQKVEIEMASFPAAEFGKLHGTVSSISLVPGKGGYLVKVRLPEKLVSSFGYELKINPNMVGKAKIITNERRLLHRFFDGLIYAINR